MTGGVSAATTLTVNDCKATLPLVSVTRSKTGALSSTWSGVGSQATTPRIGSTAMPADKIGAGRIISIIVWHHGRCINRPCAKKLGKGGEDVKDDTFKTFHWSLVGNQSHPVELGQRPEASLAWGSAMATAKRRQPVPKPCY